MKQKKKTIISAAVSAVIFILVFYAWYLMFAQSKGQTFTRRGFASLKYFTVDSNLLMGIAAFFHLICSAEAIQGKRKNIPVWSEKLFYAGTVSVFLTFGMVMVYLGPVFGYGKMFEHSSLYFHLIIPVLSILALCLLHREHRISLKESFSALIPLLLYGIYYLGMIIRYGLDRPRADWYWLAAGGMKSIPFVFTLIVLCTWGIALLERLAVNGLSGKTASRP